MTKHAKTYIDPFSFPTAIAVHLNQWQRDAMLQIANNIPHTSDSELLNYVLSRGVVAVLAEDPEQGPITAEDIARKIETLRERKEHFFALPPGASGLSAHAVRPFPAPSVLYKRRQQENQVSDNFGKDVGFAQSEEGEAIVPTPHRHVERYIGFSISEKTRRMLEDFLDAHSGVTEEDALAKLLEAGLDQVEDETVSSGTPQRASEKKARAMVRLAEQLHVRAKHRCAT